jgi:hypothetical protein
MKSKKQRLSANVLEQRKNADRRKESMLRNVLSTRSSFTVLPKIPTYSFRGQGEQAPSVSTGVGNATKKEPMQYTGTRLKGIATMHKSNLVPVFSDEEAVDLATMRR